MTRILQAMQTMQSRVTTVGAAGAAGSSSGDLPSDKAAEGKAETVGSTTAPGHLGMADKVVQFSCVCVAVNSVNIVCVALHVDGRQCHCDWGGGGGGGVQKLCSQATDSSLGGGGGGCSEEVTSLPPGSLHRHDLCEYCMSHWIWMVGSVEVTPREVVGREVGWGAETLLPSNKLFRVEGGGVDAVKRMMTLLPPGNLHCSDEVS